MGFAGSLEVRQRVFAVVVWRMGSVEWHELGYSVCIEEERYCVYVQEK
jgi:hypothetical protein